MEKYNKTSSALRIVKHYQPNRKVSPIFEDTSCADIRVSLRREAKMLASVGRCLLLLGVGVSALMCVLNGFILHEQMNSIYTGSGSSSTTAIFIAMCVFGVLFAAMSAFLSLVLHGVADTLREEAKKIK